MHAGRKGLSRKETSALSLLHSIKSDVKGLLGIRDDALAAATFTVMARQLLEGDIDGFKATIASSHPSWVNERYDKDSPA